MLPEPGLSSGMPEAQDLANGQPARSHKVNGIVLVALAILVAGVTGLALALVPNIRADSERITTDGALSFDQQMIRIADRLQCPVCQGQSVAFSNSPLAGEMRRLILEKVQLGETETQIMQYFVDRYSVSILREPSWQGLNLWLWGTPIIGIGAGVTGLIWALRRMSKTRHMEVPPKASPTLEPALDPEVQALVAQYDREFLA